MSLAIKDLYLRIMNLDEAVARFEETQNQELNAYTDRLKGSIEKLNVAVEGGDKSCFLEFGVLSRCVDPDDWPKEISPIELRVFEDFKIMLQSKRYPFHCDLRNHGKGSHMNMEINLKGK